MHQMKNSARSALVKAVLNGIKQNDSEHLEEPPVLLVANMLVPSGLCTLQAELSWTEQKQISPIYIKRLDV